MGTTIPDVVPDALVALSADEFDRSRANLARMTKMKISNHELNIVAGALAGCERMADALDQVEAYRRRRAELAARSRGPIEGQTVIALPGGDATSTPAA